MSLVANEAQGVEIRSKSLRLEGCSNGFAWDNVSPLPIFHFAKNMKAARCILHERGMKAKGFLDDSLTFSENKKEVLTFEIDIEK